MDTLLSDRRNLTGQHSPILRLTGRPGTEEWAGKAEEGGLYKDTLPGEDKMAIPFSSHSIATLRLLSQREARNSKERGYWKDEDGYTEEMGSIGKEMPQTPMPTKAVLNKDFLWGFATAAYVLLCLFLISLTHSLDMAGVVPPAEG